MEKPPLPGGPHAARRTVTSTTGAQHANQVLRRVPGGVGTRGGAVIHMVAESLTSQARGTGGTAAVVAEEGPPCGLAVKGTRQPTMCPAKPLCLRFTMVLQSRR